MGLALFAALGVECVPIYAQRMTRSSFFNGDVCLDFSEDTFDQGGFVLDESSLLSEAIKSVTVSSEQTG